MQRIEPVSKESITQNDLPESLRFLTYNIACLPVAFGHQFNDLRPNLERAGDIVKAILDKDYDFIAFQEAWDPDVANYLEDALQSKYPHFVRGVNGDTNLVVTKFVSGGLMIFSKYPIIETYAEPYNNLMLGVESIGRKGFVAEKIQVGNRFITLYNTHMQAGDAFAKNVSAWYGGTPSHRRGEQAQRILDHLNEWATKAPPGLEHLKHLETFIMGDTNIPIAGNRRKASVSIGMSNNGFDEGDIKYLGVYNLFETLRTTSITNFFNVKEERPERKGTHKRTDPDKMAYAIKNNKFTTSEKGNSTSIQGGNQLVDLMGIVKKDGPQIGAFETKLVTFETDYALSDHFPGESIYYPYQPYFKEENEYEHSVPEPRSGKDPSEGVHCSHTGGRFKLFPTYSESDSDSEEITSAYSSNSDSEESISDSASNSESSITQFELSDFDSDNESSPMLRRRR